MKQCEKHLLWFGLNWLSVNCASFHSSELALTCWIRLFENSNNLQLYLLNIVYALYEEIISGREVLYLLFTSKHYVIVHLQNIHIIYIYTLIIL